MKYVQIYASNLNFRHFRGYLCSHGNFLGTFRNLEKKWELLGMKIAAKFGSLIVNAFQGNCRAKLHVMRTFC